MSFHCTSTSNSSSELHSSPQSAADVSLRTPNHNHEKPSNQQQRKKPGDHCFQQILPAVSMCMWPPLKTECINHKFLSKQHCSSSESAMVVLECQMSLLIHVDPCAACFPCYNPVSLLVYMCVCVCRHSYSQVWHTAQGSQVCATHESLYWPCSLLKCGLLSVPVVERQGIDVFMYPRPRKEITITGLW